ncbi:MAG: hypothetical protein S4CHLAM45_07900 [Chlamydiales bacterium]|nr:hypothetical protein [Chlamydiales bacterium]MCH9620000.1 hypothetical protein [Chlamydiales bacterium]MCH9622896.1 hypothetical protein [Chlamydiales bacterium]
MRLIETDNPNDPRRKMVLHLPNGTKTFVEGKGDLNGIKVGVGGQAGALSQEHADRIEAVTGATLTFSTAVAHPGEINFKAAPFDISGGAQMPGYIKPEGVAATLGPPPMKAFANAHPPCEPSEPLLTPQNLRKAAYDSIVVPAGRRQLARHMGPKDLEDIPQRDEFFRGNAVFSDSPMDYGEFSRLMPLVEKEPLSASFVYLMGRSGTVFTKIGDLSDRYPIDWEKRATGFTLCNSVTLAKTKRDPVVYKPIDAVVFTIEKKAEIPEDVCLTLTTYLMHKRIQRLQGD